MSTLKNHWKLLASAAMVSVALTGCGSDGNDGDNGKPGEPGPVGLHVLQATSLNTQITGVSFDEAGVTTVNFDLTDANGVALHGLKDMDIAGLSVGRIGNEAELALDNIDGKGREIWLSYYTKTKGELDGESLYAGSSYYSGLSYSGAVNCLGCLTDNGDGSYTLVTKGQKEDGSEFVKAIDTNGLYEVKTDVTNGAYLTIKVRNEDASEVHLADGSYLNTAGYFYWQPASDLEQPRPKHVIANENCESCHRPEQDGNLGNMHHPGKHTTMDSCTFCHTDMNEYTVKDETGAVVGKKDGSIKGLAHAIHAGSYFGDNGIYPQSIADCNACHTDGGEGEPAQAAAWMADLDTATCQNCHGEFHGGSQDYNCVACHGAEGDMSMARGALDAHFTTNAKQIGYALDVAATNPVFSDDGTELSIDFTITDNGVAVPLANTNFVTGSKTLVVSATYGKDFVAAKLRNSAGPVAVSETDGVITMTTSTAILDGSATMDIAGLKAAVENGATLAAKLIGKVCVKDGAMVDCTTADAEQTYIVGGTIFFPADETAVQGREQFATMENCQACHNEGLKHYYTDDIDGCAMCHNRTRAKSDTGTMLARVVHENHYISRMDTAGNPTDLFFKKTECVACHEGGNFGLQKYDANSQPVAFATQDDGTVLWNSPQAAACISCHKPMYLGEAGIAHIESNGGQVLVQEFDASTVESCNVCHSDAFISDAHSNFGSH